MGLGKSRSPFGKWVDEKGLKQEDVATGAKVNRDTVSLACSDETYVPGAIVMKKLMGFVRKYKPDARADEYFRL